MAVLLMTEPCGARFPRGKQTVLVRPSSRGPLGRQDHVIGIDAVALPEPSAQGLRAAGEASHQASDSPSVRPLTVSASSSSRPSRADRSITSGTPPAR